MQISNFSLVSAKLNAYCEKDLKALGKEKFGYTKFQNVTTTWIREGCPSTPKKLQAFQINLLFNRKKWGKPEYGYIITVKQARWMRNHAGKLTTHRVGFKKLQRVYELRLSDDTLIGQASTKVSAQKLAWKLLNKYRENIYCKLVMKILNPNETVFELEHIPPPGQYILFGCKRKQDDYVNADETDFFVQPVTDKTQEK